MFLSVSLPKDVHGKSIENLNMFSKVIQYKLVLYIVIPLFTVCYQEVTSSSQTNVLGNEKKKVFIFLYKMARLKRVSILLHPTKRYGFITVLRVEKLFKFLNQNSMY